jgi:ribosomal protein S12 methylthiotransferase
MLGTLVRVQITPEQSEADVIVVNTCGFIESAKEESIEAVLDAAKMKQHGRCAKVIIAGCLAQRYKGELLAELPEADAVVGTAEIGRIGEICRAAMAGHGPVLEVGAPTMVYGLPRLSTTPRHYRYLKIAEGCSNRCSYCAIPLIRGNFTSRPKASILDEARRLADEGAKELILLAQDSTAYRDGEADLSMLLRGLPASESNSAITPIGPDQRLMTVWPRKKICKYLIVQPLTTSLAA